MRDFARVEAIGGSVSKKPDDDPLRFYRQILALAKKQLNHGGQVWFEINEQMGEEMLSLCRETGFDCTEIMLDFNGRPRFCHTR